MIYTVNVWCQGKTGTGLPSFAARALPLGMPYLEPMGKAWAAKERKPVPGTKRCLRFFFPSFIIV